jgi:peroxiredoxin
MIAIGDKIENTVFFEYMLSDNFGCTIGINKHDAHALCNNKKIVLTGVPGAFTPTCSEQHLPDFIKKTKLIKSHGVDSIFFMAVNDPFVMAYWGEKYKIKDEVRMLGDPAAEFTKSHGLEMDLSEAGLGLRSKRFTLVVSSWRLCIARLKIAQKIIKTPTP